MGTRRHYRRIPQRRVLTVRTYVGFMGLLGVGLVVLWRLGLVSWQAGLVSLPAGTVLLLLVGILRKEITFHIAWDKNKRNQPGGPGH